MDYHAVLGAIAAILAVVIPLSYVRGIFQGHNKPHALTWLTFTIINGTVFFAQIAKSAGAGAWMTGISTFTAFMVAYFAMRKGEKNIRSIDWVSFGGALLGILWSLTSEPLTAVIIASIVNALALAPTVRKSLSKPFEEPALNWFFGGVQFVLGALALETFTLTTALFPVAVAAMLLSFALLLFIRRKQFGSSAVS